MVNQLEDLIKEISEDLQLQIERQAELSEPTKAKLKGIGINPALPIHEIVRLLAATKLNMDELNFYYFGKRDKP